MNKCCAEFGVKIGITHFEGYTKRKHRCRKCNDVFFTVEVALPHLTNTLNRKAATDCQLRATVAQLGPKKMGGLRSILGFKFDKHMLGYIYQRKSL